MRAALVLALLALACAAHAQVATLRLLTNYTQSLGARCLDGSAPGAPNLWPSVALCSPTHDRRATLCDALNVLCVMVTAARHSLHR